MLSAANCDNISFHCHLRVFASCYLAGNDSITIHRRLPLLSALASYLDLASARSVMLQQAGKIHHHFSLYHLNHLDCTN